MDIKQYREQELQKNNVCHLCGLVITKDQAVLDHCHVTGRVRGVLHRNCNQVEGRIRSWLKRIKNPREFLKKLQQYTEQDYSNNPIHPKHITEQKKRFKRLSKAKQKELGHTLENVWVLKNRES